MTMKRHFFVSDDLDDLKNIERELKALGFEDEQLHILSHADADIEKHQLHNVEAVLRKDVVHSMELGALAGCAAAAALLLTAYLLNWTATAAGWLPFLFLAVVILGFFTWEGGLFGIQEPHHQFKRFQRSLNSGDHIFFVDTHEKDKDALNVVINKHPRLSIAGVGEAPPTIVLNAQRCWHDFLKAMP